MDLDKALSIARETVKRGSEVPTVCGVYGSLLAEIERLQRYPAAIKELRSRQFADRRVCDDIEQLVQEAAKAGGK